MKKEYQSPLFQFLKVEMIEDVLSTSFPSDEDPTSTIGGNDNPVEDPNAW